MYTKFKNLRQGIKSVDEYASEFFPLLARNNLTETEEQLVSRFICGLRLQIQNKLLQFNPLSVSEPHQRVLLIQQQTRNASTTWSASSRSRTTTTTYSNAIRPSDSPSPQGSLAPIQELNDTPTAARSTRSSSFRCFGCGEQGHRQSACPQ